MIGYEGYETPVWGSKKGYPNKVGEKLNRLHSKECGASEKIRGQVTHYIDEVVLTKEQSECPIIKVTFQTKKYYDVQPGDLVSISGFLFSAAGIAIDKGNICNNVQLGLRPFKGVKE